MPNTEDAPAIFASIDHKALSQPVLTEEQRTAAGLSVFF